MAEDSANVKGRKSTDPDVRREVFLEDITRDADAQWEQSLAANDDMLFINKDGGMWLDFFEEENNDRARLEFDVTNNFVQNFLGRWDQNRVGVEFKPDDSKGETSSDDAELLNGIFRSDFDQFGGIEAVDTAVSEVATCGYGAFKLGTRKEDEEDDENLNQRIEWRAIRNAFNTVFWDSAAQNSDKRDARWVTQLKEFTMDSFEDEYPGEDPVSAYQPWKSMAMGASFNHKDIIYIAIRYERVFKKENFFIYNNLESGKVERYNEEDHKEIENEKGFKEFRTFVGKRVKKIPRIEKTVFSGAKTLEKTRRISGKWLPIIPIYGYRGYANGQEYYRGLVRKLKDPNRVLNTQFSQLQENAASNGQNIPLFDPDQMPPNISAEWEFTNNKRWLPRKLLRDADENPIITTTEYLQPPQLDPNVQSLIEKTTEFIRNVTGGAVQEVFDPKMSGKAMKLFIKQRDMNTHVITANIAKSIRSSGDVYQAMASEVYTTRGRIINTLGLDGTDSQKVLGELIQDKKTQEFKNINDLSGKKFKTVIDVGPQYESMREQTVEDLKGMADYLKDSPGGEIYMPAVIAVMLQNITGVGLQPIKDLSRKQLVLLDLVKPDNEEEEALLQQAQAPKEDPEKELIQAAAKQAESEAEERSSKVADNLASANKKAAEKEKILRDLPNIDAEAAARIRKIDAEIEQSLFENVQGFPI